MIYRCGSSLHSCFVWLFWASQKSFWLTWETSITTGINITCTVGKTTMRFTKYYLCSDLPTYNRYLQHSNNDARCKYRDSMGCSKWFSQMHHWHFSPHSFQVLRYRLNKYWINYFFYILFCSKYSYRRVRYSCVSSISQCLEPARALFLELRFFIS